MRIPGNMTAPKLRVEDGEQVIQSAECFRKTKFLFGSLYGELHVTNQRVVFVKAVMGGLVAKVAFLNGAKPKIAFDRAAITSVATESYKNTTALVVSDGVRSEKFLIEQPGLDAVMRQLQT
jgi:hypothetical protein